MGFYYVHIDANGICYSVSQLADAIPENATTIKIDTYDLSLLGKKYANGAWVVDPPLLTAQKAKISELDAAADNALKTMSSNALGTAHTYLADDKSMLYMTGEYGFVKGNDYDGKPIPWYTVENVYQNHTAAQFVQAFLDVRAGVQANRVKHDTKVKQANACTTTAQVATVTFNNTTPPTVPIGLTGTAGATGSGQATLSWTANTDVTMLYGGGYNVYKGGVKVNTSLVTAATYTATGLAAGSYSYAITAVDTDGNESSKSVAVSVTIS